MGQIELHSSDLLILEDAITTLALMAKRTRHRRALACNGASVKLVEVLKHNVGVQPVVIATCRFLVNFAVKEDLRLTVLHSGGINALIASFATTMQKVAQAVVGMQSSIASALWSCALECKEVQAALTASKLLQMLIVALQASPNHSNLHEAALGILRCLSRNAAC